jgi:putative SOS response-associated peptidase YedK
MCGRYGFTSSAIELSERFDAERADWDLRDSYNIAPTQESPVIERHSPNKIYKRKWGIFPGFMKGGVLINAQAEKLAASPVWKKSFLESRCIVPFNFFYEWKVLSDGKQPYVISVGNKELHGFAGLIVTTKDKDGVAHTGYVIITTAANPMMREIHNTKHRMPVILRKDDEATWLNPDISESEQLEQCLRQYPEQHMEAYPISSLVNTPKNNFPELLNPVKL